MTGGIRQRFRMISAVGFDLRRYCTCAVVTFFVLETKGVLGTRDDRPHGRAYCPYEAYYLGGEALPRAARPRRRLLMMQTMP